MSDGKQNIGKGSCGSWSFCSEESGCQILTSALSVMHWNTLSKLEDPEGSHEFIFVFIASREPKALMGL